MWQHKAVAVAGVLSACLLIAALTAVAQQSESYDVPWSVFGSGGGESQSENYKSQFTIGQPAAGDSESDSYEVHAGFWPGALGAGATPTPTPTPTPTATPKPVIEVELFAGWNFGTWRQDACVPIRQAVENLTDEGVLDLTGRFVAEQQSWLLFDPSAPDVLNTLTELCNDQITVLHVSEAITWLQDP